MTEFIARVGVPIFGYVDLNWTQNGEADLAGYIVSYGTTSGFYTSTLDVGLTPTPATPGITLTQLERYGIIYFVVQAYDNAVPRNVSARSNEVSKAISPRMFPLTWP